MKIGQEGDTRKFGRLKGDQRKRACELEGEKASYPRCVTCGTVLKGQTRKVRVAEGVWECSRCANEG